MSILKYSRWGLKQGFWLVGSAIALGLLTMSFFKNQPTIQLDMNALSSSVDAVIINLSVYQFDETGKLAHYLFTPELQHIPLNNTHNLTAPHIKISQANQPDWQIHAKLAHATQGGKAITFTGNVIIEQDEKGNRLNTEELTYYPEQKLALSPAMVQFKQPGSTVQSQGMRAYLDKKNIQLLSRPYATFNPKHG